MTSRRDVLLLGCKLGLLLAAPLGAEAQQGAKVARISYLTTSLAPEGRYVNRGPAGVLSPVDRMFGA